MKPVLEPWQKIAWGPERQQTIYRDWGKFYQRYEQLDIASQFYDKSLELKEDDARALYQRSMCKRNMAKTEGALKDATASIALNDKAPPFDIEYCDAIYEMNTLEECKINLFNKARKYRGNRAKPFYDRIEVLNENFKDCIGLNLKPFIMANQRVFAKVMTEQQRKNFIDPRPLWKMLKAEGKCDVLSIMEQEDKRLSPREIARRERCNNVFTQIYFNKPWVDIMFMKSLRENPDLMLPQSKVSTPHLREYVQSKYDVVIKFLKMLQARSPIYNEMMVRCPNKVQAEKNLQAHLFRVQYQTRRNMVTILHSIRQLRKLGNITKLAAYVEEIMGDYIVLKTHRIMPWKFEFINEVYNTLALAHTDRFTIPPDVKSVKVSQRVHHLLRLPYDKFKEFQPFVFGVRSTYQEPEMLEAGMIAYKKMITRYEKRMQFAEHSIERSYLLHEIARQHLSQNRFEECCAVARKAMEEAKICSSNIWQFLSVMLMVKAKILQFKIERCKESLDEAKEICERLYNPPLMAFIDTCLKANLEDIDLRKRLRSMEASKAKTRSRMSILSRGSIGMSRQSLAGTGSVGSNEGEINPRGHKLSVYKKKKSEDDEYD